MEYCRFWLLSRCSKGASCNYRHELPPTAPTTASGSANSTLRAKKTCSFFLRGACRNGDACTYSHEKPNGDTATTVSESLITCKYFKQGKCLRGADCPYDHPVAAEGGEPEPESTYDSFLRELCGNLVQFGDGGSVTKVSMASDFSSVKLEELPTASTSVSVSQLLQDLGHQVPPTTIQLSAGQRGPTAYITSPDSSFAKAVCETLSHANNQNIQASIALPRLPPWAASRRISCKKVVISWEQPTRTVYLRYDPADDFVASMVAVKFRSGAFKICGQKISASPTARTGLTSTVSLTHVPQNVSKQDIEDAIQPAILRPQLIDLGHTDGETATDSILSLLRNIGPFEFTLVTGPYRRHAKAVATFMDESDAKEAVKSLHDQPQMFLSDRSMSLQLLRSSYVRVPRKIYDAVEDQLAACVPEWAEQGLRYNVCVDPTSQKRFVTLKVEGGNEKDVAQATNTIDRIAAGRVVKDGNSNFWSLTLMTDVRTLKQIETQHGVLIVRHKPKRQLRYYGPPELFRDVTAAVISRLKVPLSKRHAIHLSAEQFSWLCRGGLQQVTAALRPAVVSLDVMARPKRLVISGGSGDMHQRAKTILEREYSGQSSQVPAMDNCAICFTEPDDPLTLECGHDYCRECFENLCSSPGSASTDFSVKCQGNGGACERIVPLLEMKQSLPSAIFESVLETAFARFINRRPGSFRHCPTADCGSIIRVLNEQHAAKSLTCPRCFITVCTRCYQPHDNTITCDEHKDLSTGGHEAFDRFKKQMNIKDCPRCSTSIEKIDGCNHMECSGCKGHICWVCLKSFDESGPCYQHMTDVHGGNGIQDEIDEDMDD